MNSGDLENVETDEQCKFLTVKNCYTQNMCNTGVHDALLTREDLLRLEKAEPIWRRLRIMLLIMFWVIWIGLLVASVIIIVVSPKCPPKPSLNFWQSKFGYWVDPFAFKDSGTDSVGDFKGLVEKLDYIKNTIGAGFLIIGSFVSGQYSGVSKTLGSVLDFYTVDEALGSMEDFRTFVKAYHKSGLEVVVTLNLNSISTSHKWAKNSTFLKAKDSTTWVARDGSSPNVSIDEQQYYSVLDKDSVDLDLQSVLVKLEMEKILDFWLKEGADGILLSGVAFYVETNDGTLQQKRVAETSNKWFKNYPSSQLFTNESVQFVSSMRAVVDRISALTSKPRLLAVDVGNCGYGLGDKPDEALRFLGSVETPAAHLVVSRQFVKNRGWKEIPLNKHWRSSSIENYNAISGEFKNSLALTTATPSEQRYNDHISLASTFLLPGTPLVYYGTELGITPSGHNISLEKLYPTGKVPFPNLSEMDSEFTCHLPMPWDRSGHGFSSNHEGYVFGSFLDQFGITETVQSATSAGRGKTSFQLFQSLRRLRTNPSLLWGTFDQVVLNYTINPTSSKMQVEMFTRKAEGYPSFIVLFVNAPNFGQVFKLPAAGKLVIPRLIYPSSPNLLLDKPIDGNSVYLITSKDPAVYVFEIA